MQWGAVASYLSRTFLEADGSGWLSHEVLLGLFFTILSFAMGWVFSRGGVKRRLKARVIQELILCQSELFSRAYPSHWKQDGQREAWMLDPFVARLRFLYESLNESKSLNRRQLDRIEYYLMRVQDFIAIWANTQRRYEPYHEAYKVAYIGARLAVQELGLKQLGRFAGLARPNDQLFGSAPLATPAPQSAAPVATGGMVPAE